MKICLITHEECLAEKMTYVQKGTKDALNFKHYVERRLRESGIDLRRQMKKQVFTRKDNKHDVLISQDENAPLAKEKHQLKKPVTEFQKRMMMEGMVLK